MAHTLNSNLFRLGSHSTLIWGKQSTSYFFNFKIALFNYNLIRFFFNFFRRRSLHVVEVIINSSDIRLHIFLVLFKLYKEKRRLRIPKLTYETLLKHKIKNGRCKSLYRMKHPRRIVLKNRFYYYFNFKRFFLEKSNFLNSSTYCKKLNYNFKNFRLYYSINYSTTNEFSKIDKSNNYVFLKNALTKPFHFNFKRYLSFTSKIMHYNGIDINNLNSFFKNKHLKQASYFVSEFVFFKTRMQSIKKKILGFDYKAYKYFFRQQFINFFFKLLNRSLLTSDFKKFICFLLSYLYPNLVESFTKTNFFGKHDPTNPNIIVYEKYKSYAKIWKTNQNNQKNFDDILKKNFNYWYYLIKFCSAFIDFSKLGGGYSENIKSFYLDLKTVEPRMLHKYDHQPVTRLANYNLIFKDFSNFEFKNIFGFFFNTQRFNILVDFTTPNVIPTFVVNTYKHNLKINKYIKLAKTDTSFSVKKAFVTVDFFYNTFVKNHQPVSNPLKLNTYYYQRDFSFLTGRHSFLLTNHHYDFKIVNDYFTGLRKLMYGKRRPNPFKKHNDLTKKQIILTSYFSNKFLTKDFLINSTIDTRYEFDNEYAKDVLRYNTFFDVQYQNYLLDYKTNVSFEKNLIKFDKKLNTFDNLNDIYTYESPRYVKFRYVYPLANIWFRPYHFIKNNIDLLRYKSFMRNLKLSNNFLWSKRIGRVLNWFHIAFVNENYFVNKASTIGRLPLTNLSVFRNLINLKFDSFGKTIQTKKTFWYTNGNKKSKIFVVLNKPSGSTDSRQNKLIYKSKNRFFTNSREFFIKNVHTKRTLMKGSGVNNLHYLLMRENKNARKVLYKYKSIRNRTYNNNKKIKRPNPNLTIIFKKFDDLLLRNKLWLKTIKMLAKQEKYQPKYGRLGIDLNTLTPQYKIIHDALLKAQANLIQLIYEELLGFYITQTLSIVKKYSDQSDFVVFNSNFFFNTLNKKISLNSFFYHLKKFLMKFGGVGDFSNKLDFRNFNLNSLSIYENLYKNIAQKTQEVTNKTLFPKKFTKYNTMFSLINLLSFDFLQHTTTLKNQESLNFFKKSLYKTYYNKMRSSSFNLQKINYFFLIFNKYVYDTFILKPKILNNRTYLLSSLENYQNPGVQQNQKWLNYDLVFAKSKPYSYLSPSNTFFFLMYRHWYNVFFKPNRYIKYRHGRYVAQPWYFEYLINEPADDRLLTQIKKAASNYYLLKLNIAAEDRINYYSHLWFLNLYHLVYLDSFFDLFSKSNGKFRPSLKILNNEVFSNTKIKVLSLFQIKYVLKTHRTLNINKGFKTYNILKPPFLNFKPHLVINLQKTKPKTNVINPLYFVDHILIKINFFLFKLNLYQKFLLIEKSNIKYILNFCCFKVFEVYPNYHPSYLVEKLNNLYQSGFTSIFNLLQLSYFEKDYKFFLLRNLPQITYTQNMNNFFSFFKPNNDTTNLTNLKIFNDQVTSNNNWFFNYSNKLLPLYFDSYDKALMFYFKRNQNKDLFKNWYYSLNNFIKFKICMQILTRITFFSQIKNSITKAENLIDYICTSNHPFNQQTILNNDLVTASLSVQQTCATYIFNNRYQKVGTNYKNSYLHKKLKNLLGCATYTYTVPTRKIIELSKILKSFLYYIVWCQKNTKKKPLTYVWKRQLKFKPALKTTQLTNNFKNIYLPLTKLQFKFFLNKNLRHINKITEFLGFKKLQSKIKWGFKRFKFLNKTTKQLTNHVYLRKQMLNYLLDSEILPKQVFLKDQMVSPCVFAFKSRIRNNFLISEPTTHKTIGVSLKFLGFLNGFYKILTQQPQNQSPWTNLRRKLYLKNNNEFPKFEFFDNLIKSNNDSFLTKTKLSKDVQTLNNLPTNLNIQKQLTLDLLGSKYNLNLLKQPNLKTKVITSYDFNSIKYYMILQNLSLLGFITNNLIPCEHVSKVRYIQKQNDAKLWPGNVNKKKDNLKITNSYITELLHINNTVNTWLNLKTLKLDPVLQLKKIKHSKTKLTKPKTKFFVYKLKNNKGYFYLKNKINQFFYKKISTNFQNTAFLTFRTNTALKNFFFKKQHQKRSVTNYLITLNIPKTQIIFGYQQQTLQHGLLGLNSQQKNKVNRFLTNACVTQQIDLNTGVSTEPTKNLLLSKKHVFLNDPQLVAFLPNINALIKTIYSHIPHLKYNDNFIKNTILLSSQMSSFSYFYNLFLNIINLSSFDIYFDFIKYNFIGPKAPKNTNSIFIDNPYTPLFITTTTNQAYNYYYFIFDCLINLFYNFNKTTNNAVYYDANYTFKIADIFNSSFNLTYKSFLNTTTSNLNPLNSSEKKLRLIDDSFYLRFLNVFLREFKLRFDSFNKKKNTIQNTDLNNKLILLSKQKLLWTINEHNQINNQNPILNSNFITQFFNRGTFNNLDMLLATLKIISLKQTPPHLSFFLTKNSYLNQNDIHNWQVVAFKTFNNCSNNALLSTFDSLHSLFINQPQKYYKLLIRRSAQFLEHFFKKINFGLKSEYKTKHQMWLYYTRTNAVQFLFRDHRRNARQFKGWADSGKSYDPHTYARDMIKYNSVFTFFSKPLAKNKLLYQPHIFSFRRKLLRSKYFYQGRRSILYRILYANLYKPEVLEKNWLTGLPPIANQLFGKTPVKTIDYVIDKHNKPKLTASKRSFYYYDPRGDLFLKTSRVNKRIKKVLRYMRKVQLLFGKRLAYRSKLYRSSKYTKKYFSNYNIKSSLSYSKVSKLLRNYNKKLVNWLDNILILGFSLKLKNNQKQSVYFNLTKQKLNLPLRPLIKNPTNLTEFQNTYFEIFKTTTTTPNLKTPTQQLYKKQLNKKYMLEHGLFFYKNLRRKLLSSRSFLIRKKRYLLYTDYNGNNYRINNNIKSSFGKTHMIKKWKRWNNKLFLRRVFLHKPRSARLYLKTRRKPIQFKLPFKFNNRIRLKRSLLNRLINYTQKLPSKHNWPTFFFKKLTLKKKWGYLFRLFLISKKLLKKKLTLKKKSKKRKTINLLKKHKINQRWTDFNTHTKQFYNLITSNVALTNIDTLLFKDLFGLKKKSVKKRAYVSYRYLLEDNNPYYSKNLTAIRKLIKPPQKTPCKKRSSFKKIFFTPKRKYSSFSVKKNYIHFNTFLNTKKTRQTQNIGRNSWQKKHKIIFETSVKKKPINNTIRAIIQKWKSYENVVYKTGGNRYKTPTVYLGYAKKLRRFIRYKHQLFKNFPYFKKRRRRGRSWPPRWRRRSYRYKLRGYVNGNKMFPKFFKQASRFEYLFKKAGFISPHKIRKFKKNRKYWRFNNGIQTLMSSKKAQWRSRQQLVRLPNNNLKYNTIFKKIPKTRFYNRSAHILSHINHVKRQDFNFFMRGGNVFLKLKGNIFCLVKTLNKKTILNEKTYQNNLIDKPHKYYALVYNNILYVLDKGTVYSVSNTTNQANQKSRTYKSLNSINSRMLIKDDSFIYYVYKNKLYFFKKYDLFTVPTLKHTNYFYKKTTNNQVTDFDLPLSHVTQLGNKRFKTNKKLLLDYKKLGGSGWVDYSRFYFTPTSKNLKKSFKTLLNTDKGRTLFSNFLKKNIPNVRNILNLPSTNNFYDQNLLTVRGDLKSESDVSQNTLYSYVGVLNSLKREEASFTISYKLEQNFISFLNNLELKNSENLKLQHTTQNSFGLKFKRLFSRAQSMKLKHNKSPINLSYKSWLNHSSHYNFAINTQLDSYFELHYHSRSYYDYGKDTKFLDRLFNGTSHFFVYFKKIILNKRYNNLNFTKISLKLFDDNSVVNKLTNLIDLREVLFTALTDYVTWKATISLVYKTVLKQFLSTNFMEKATLVWDEEINAPTKDEDDEAVESLPIEEDFMGYLLSSFYFRMCNNNRNLNYRKYGNQPRLTQASTGCFPSFLLQRSIITFKKTSETTKCNNWLFSKYQIKRFELFLEKLIGNYTPIHLEIVPTKQLFIEHESSLNQLVSSTFNLNYVHKTVYVFTKNFTHLLWFGLKLFNIHSVITYFATEFQNRRKQRYLLAIVEKILRYSTFKDLIFKGFVLQISGKISRRSPRKRTIKLIRGSLPKYSSFDVKICYTYRQVISSFGVYGVKAWLYY